MCSEEYYHWSSIDDGWICPRCEREALPFFDTSHLTSTCSSSLSESSEFSNSSSISFPRPRSSYVSKEFSILYFNARSLLPKLDELRTTCLSHSYDIIMVTETWLSAVILDYELYIPGYCLLRRDRNRNGGGVLMYVSSNLTSRSLQHREDLELLLMECVVGRNKCTFGCFYRPPNLDLSQCLNKLHNVIAALRPANLANLTICGDFNVDAVSSLSSLSSILKDFHLSQVVTDPTRVTNSSATLIDLVLMSNPNILNSCVVQAPVSNSDHNTICVKLNLPLHKEKQSKQTKKIWIYNKADIQLGKSLLKNLPVASDSDDLNRFWKVWSHGFMTIMEKCIPSKVVPIHNKTPWIKRNLLKLIKRREYLYRRFRSSKCNDWLFKYKTLRNDIVSKLRTAKASIFSNLATVQSDPKKFWAIIRSLKPHITSTEVFTDGLSIASTPMQKANMLNTFFSGCFNPVTVPANYCTLPNPSSLPEHLDCTVDEVVNLLKKTKVHSASGPDGVSAWMLHTFADELAPSIASLFNLSLKAGKLPDEWKMANVVPIPKNSHIQDVRSYRPISLLSIISKTLERFVHRILMEHLSANSVITNHQYGFQLGRSTVTPLLLATHSWHNHLERRVQVGCIFLDLCKAFDSVPHQALLNKLCGLNLPTTIFNWLRDYLSNRHQQVVYDGVTSQALPVKSGVPQGSILGPLLFLLYINDLPSCLSPEDSSIVLYADDILLYRPIKTESDCKAFQQDINKIVNWISENHLTINVEKTKCMTISRLRSTIPLQVEINGHQIEEVITFKYLGVWISSDLSWTKHIEITCSKARRVLGYMYRTFAPYCEPDTIISLYKSQVLPILDYASVVWEPHLKKDKLLLEAVQLQATRMASRQWKENGVSLNQRFELPTLENRRKYFKLLLTYKFLSGYTYCPTGYFVQHPNPNPRLFHSKYIVQPFAKTEAYYHSFFIDSVRLWNSLPNSIVNSPSVLSFKTGIRLYLSIN